MEHDSLKKLLDQDTTSAPGEGAVSDARRAEKIVRSVQSKQNQGDLLEFGIVKFWTVILEFFAQLHRTAHKRSREKRVLANKPESECQS